MRNFYVLYGLDTGLIKTELKKLLEKFDADDIIYYDLSNDRLLDVIEDAATISMFSSKKIIVVENTSFLGANKSVDNIEELEKYIGHYNEDTYMIFIVNSETIDSRKKIVKKLKEIGEIKELNAVDEKYLNSYVSKYLKDRNYQMKDIEYFLDKVGKNLNNINNELEKLVVYKTQDKKILNEDIDKILVSVLENEIFVLSDAIIARDVDKSLKLLKKFLDNNYEEIQIIMLLAGQFRFLFQVKRLLNKNKSDAEIAKILGANPYRIKFAKKKLYNYSESLLLNYIKRIAKMDRDIKLGMIDKRLALELFIIEMKIEDFS